MADPQHKLLLNNISFLISRMIQITRGSEGNNNLSSKLLKETW